MKIHRMVPLVILSVATLVLAEELETIPDQRQSITGPMIEDLLAEHRDLTYDGLRKALPEAEYRTELGFDPTEARYFDLICRELHLTGGEIAAYRKHGFVCVDQGAGHSFTTAYHRIYTADLPVMVTTDSILHAMHKSYDEMLKQLESTWFSWTMSEILEEMHTALGSELKAGHDASLTENHRDLDLYLTAARWLLDPHGGVRHKMNQDPGVTEMLSKITSLKLELPGEDQPTELYGGSRFIDYSQFRPRGHYTETQRLQNYFRAMMWLGRVDTGWNVLPVDPSSGIVSDDRRELRNAVLFVELLRKTGNVDRLRRVDKVVSYMVGNSDSLGYARLAELMDECGVASANDLRAPARLATLQEAIRTSEAAKQVIRSQIVCAPMDSRQAQIPATFQVFGQRFVIDSYVLAQVVYDSITFGGLPQFRMMPTGLDVMAALGNETAVTLLEPELQRGNYSANLLAGRRFVEQQGPEFWNANLYSLWLDSLRELDAGLQEEQHAPKVMQTAAWQRKQLRTQLASWSQLRHDTILYAKQSYTSVPGCEYLSGYVEPYPEFYAKIGRFASRAGALIKAAPYRSKDPERHEALQKIHGKQVAFFARMEELLGQLETLARKELAAEPFSPQEADFIARTISKFGSAALGSGDSPAYNGWYVELFYENWNMESGGMLSFFPRAPSGKDGRTDWALKPTIADVHTDPESRSVLEVGIGELNFCVIAVDSEEDRIAFVGPTLSYYEFEQPAGQRLTDEEWTKMLRSGSAPPPPAWTRDFAPGPAKTPRSHPQPQVVFLRGNAVVQKKIWSPAGQPAPEVHRVDRTQETGEIVRFDIISPQPGKPAARRFVEVELTDEGLAALRKVPGTLRALDLSKAPVSDRGLAHLAHLANLRNLSLAETKVTGSGLAALQGASWLRRLLMADAPITDEGVAHLVALPRLEILDLGGTRITPNAIRSLQQLTYLRELTLTNTAIKEEQIDELRRSLPHCKIVD